ncbi:hypothetical protein FUAX_38540 (plasmid) [Fulvitalea axinellae]|uniref:Uncharacterized protein n=1 Tax=Fulvitalea axinellae TaxID=1182444 RepID=A0AAU9D163_9BACT|nr:hypothetical protein FUAX_38540 [Fulvitalea axinellae]
MYRHGNIYRACIVIMDTSRMLMRSFFVPYQVKDFLIIIQL